MEVVLISLLFGIYMTIRYFWVDHDTMADKDRKRFQKGVDLVRLRKYDEAYQYFNDAVRHHPKSAIAYAYRGKCQLIQENYYSAIYDLTEAISRDNTLADCYLDRGIAFYNTAEYQQAFREFDKAVWHFRDEKPDAYRWRALARVQLRQLPQAENDLRRAVILGDENSFHLLLQPPFTRPNPVMKS
ncbi:tetratricopeptide repeat protein [Spirosoma sp. BT702]|uniref:Tetratricopeptide repeat protein n=1 Tax=Spirosoma profusum TaxID=2771354 RepID=A0A927AUP5_9BACT|nr:tetratricopeptide repeat protein [Spirosoma profusum]MBD2704745.1 tetratricopeptide repeat protein [Spirosoma profusum]